MKDFIQVDSDLATSYFAQINRGAVTKSSASSQNTQQNSESNGKESTNQGTAKIAFGIDAGWDKKITYLEDTNSLISTNDAEATEIILHDYLIDSLISALTDMKAIKEVFCDFKEGDFVLYRDSSTILDLDTAKNNLNSDVFKTLMSFDDEDKNRLALLKKTTPKTHEVNLAISSLKTKIEEDEASVKQTSHTIERMQDMTSKLSALFPDTVIIKTGDSISLCDKDKFRLSPSAMLPITLSSRPITIFGIVISKARANDVDMNGGIFDILSKSSLFMPETILREMNIKKDGDYNIRPIAIYFEDIEVSD